MSIHVEATAQASWQSLIQEAVAKVPYSINDDLESYLVSLLIRFTKHYHLANTILALEYLESHSLTGAIKQEHLRDVGDKCLLFSGFYPEQAHRKLVNLQYFVNLGRGAYAEIAKTNHSNTLVGLNHLFAELATNFVILLEILHQIKLLAKSDQWMLDEIIKFEKQRLLSIDNHAIQNLADIPKFH